MNNKFQKKHLFVIYLITIFLILCILLTDNIWFIRCTIGVTIIIGILLGINYKCKSKGKKFSWRAIKEIDEEIRNKQIDELRKDKNKFRVMAGQKFKHFLKPFLLTILLVLISTSLIFITNTNNTENSKVFYDILNWIVSILCTFTLFIGIWSFRYLFESIYYYYDHISINKILKQEENREKLGKRRKGDILLF